MAETGVEAVKVAIEGLNERQCGMLEGVKVGSLIEVAVFAKVERADDGDCSESERSENASEDEDEGSESEEDGENSGEGDLDALSSGDAGGDVDTSDTTNTTPLNEPDQKDQQHGHDDVDPRAWTSSAQDAVNAGGGPQAASRANVPSGPAPQLNSTDTNSHDVVAASHEDIGDIAAVVPPGHDLADVHDDLYEAEEIDDEEDEGEGESENEDEASEDDIDEEDEVPTRLVSRGLFVVLALINDSEDDELLITDIHLRKLTYQNRGEEANINTYRIFGNVITLHDGPATVVDGVEVEILAEITTSQPDHIFDLILNPSGDHIRNTIFNHRCPARCTNGWQPDQATLQDLLSDDLEQLPHYRPLCPVCIGKELLDEQTLLRGILANMGMVDIGLVVEFIGRLNPRRRSMGYSFYQFDEREWGYGFDDMLDESGSEDTHEDEDGIERFEHWDEAMDPNANPKTRPASKATVAALPRKRFAEVARKEVGAFCAICHEGGFGEESRVVELPCGHVYDEGCLEAWIREYDNCPQCRATVSGMLEVGKREETDVEARDVDDGQGDGTRLSVPAETAQGAEGDEQGRHTLPLMDGEDTVMSDGQAA